MKPIDYIKLSWRSLTSNKLRSALTLGIIAIGITALVCILTSIEAIRGGLTANFSRLGSNTFNIQNLVHSFKSRDDNNLKRRPIITLENAENFKAKYHWKGAKVSYTFVPSFASTLKYNTTKTDPNILVKAVDIDFFTISGFNILEGRNFSNTEMQSGFNNIILGNNVYKKLFPTIGSKPLGKEILLDNKKYKIVAILDSRGKSSMTNDNVVFIATKNALNNFYNNNVNYAVTVEISDPEELQMALEEANSIFRSVRKQKYSDEDNFEISKSDRLASELFDSLNSIRYATLVIGLLTLIGAGVGLMNILLVSINERTREIGVCKALGASRKNLIYQYLTESIMLSQIGGVIGIFLGIGLGNIVALLLGSPFTIPWIWIFVGFVFCTIIGLAAGVYPAYKAGNLSPVEALRYE